MAFDIFSDVDRYSKYKRKTKRANPQKEYSYKELWDMMFNGGFDGEAPLPKVLDKSHRVVFVDADALAYRVAAACDTHTIIAKIDGKPLEFGTMTELNKYCEKYNKNKDNLTITERIDTEPEQNSYSTLKRSIKNIYKVLDATHVIFIIGGEENFRLELPLPLKYKGAREGKPRPKNLKLCKNYLLKNYDSYLIKGVEADDAVLGMTQHVINDTEAYAVAWQIDKDFHQSLMKNRYYHPVSSDIVEIEGGVGHLWEAKNTVKGDGLVWLMFQNMMFDRVDNYFMNKHYTRRYGEKSFYRDFAHIKNEKELLTTCVNKMKELLPDVIEFEDWQGNNQKHDWLSLAELYFSCCYMKTYPDDKTTLKSLLDKYGVEYE